MPTPTSRVYTRSTVPRLRSPALDRAPSFRSGFARSVLPGVTTQSALRRRHSRLDARRRLTEVTMLHCAVALCVVAGQAFWRTAAGAGNPAHVVAPANAGGTAPASNVIAPPPAPPTTARQPLTSAPRHRDASLQALVDRLVDEDNGVTAIVVQDVRTGASARYHEHDVFPAASLAKVPILVETFRRLQAGTLRPDDRITITDEAITGGAGVLQARVGDELTVAELERLAVTVSDNVAARLLLQRVGGAGSVNLAMAELGLRQTRLYADERPNTTTAADMADLMLWIATRGTSRGSGDRPHTIATTRATGLKGNEAATDALAALLALPQAQAWIAKRIPQETIVAHKSGQLPGVRNEAAIIYAPRGPVIVVGLTDQLHDQDDAESFLARLGRETLEYFR